jgi:hypothetical protein
MAFWGVHLAGRHNCAWKKRESRTGWTRSDWGRIATTIIWHVNPFARVPVIDHGDYRLYETQAQTCIAEFDRLIGNQMGPGKAGKCWRVPR